MEQAIVGTSFTNSKAMRSKVLKSQIKEIMHECQKVEMAWIEEVNYHYGDSEFMAHQNIEVDNTGGMQGMEHRGVMVGGMVDLNGNMYNPAFQE